MKKQTEKIRIQYYGKYNLGLTEKEIKEYLKNQAGVTRLGNLWKDFCQVAGCNTMALVTTDCCKKEISLMYRCDVERFTGVLLYGTLTYFD